MLSLNLSGAINYQIGGHNTLTASVAFAYNSGTKKIRITDNTVYDQGDSRKIVNIDVFDRYGGRASGHVAATAQPDVNYVDIDVAALNPARGFAAIVTVVSAKGKYKDGSIFKIADTFDAGNVTMQK